MTNKCIFSISILRTCLLAVFGIATLVPPSFAQTSLLAKTPPMGWNSWNKFGCNVSDKLIREIADATFRMKDLYSC